MNSATATISLIGLFAAVGAWIWLYVMAWRTSFNWGLAVTVLPGLIVWYVLTYKRRCTKPVIVWLTGVLVLGIAGGFGREPGDRVEELLFSLVLATIVIVCGVGLWMFPRSSKK